MPVTSDNRDSMKKWAGNFCWHGEDHLLYTTATTKAGAFRRLCHQLARRLEYSHRHVALYFLDAPSKYRIEEVLD